MLYKFPWPKVGTFDNLCLLFVQHIQEHRGTAVKVCVVFDTYRTSTTKDQEQKRRSGKQRMHADVIVEKTTPVPSDRAAFLSNKKNKQAFIELFDQFLQDNNMECEHAGDEGDADVVIVRKALEMAAIYDKVLVIADDTDIFVLLVQHASGNHDICMKRINDTLSIETARKCLGNEMCHILLFIHAMSGCDTTSAFYRIGKVKLFNMMQDSKMLRSYAMIFGIEETSKNDLAIAGELVIAQMYMKDTTKGVNALRYQLFTSPRYVPPERMPPTSRACYYHSLRVQLQVCTWRKLQTTLAKEEYGFYIENGSTIPLITDLPPAPNDLLKSLRCSCKSSKKLCASCGCTKAGLTCSTYCACEGNCENGLVTTTDHDT